MMARDQNKRKKFAASALSFIRRHNFDGLDLDWEYPGKRGGKPEDKENFILLIQDLYKVTSLTPESYVILHSPAGVQTSRPHAHSGHWRRPRDY